MYQEPLDYIHELLTDVEFRKNTYSERDRHSKIYDSIKIKKADDKLVICITLYNESQESLLISLYSISKSIEYLYRKIGDRYKVTVSIVADGIKKLSSTTLNLLDTLGIIEDRQDYNNFGVSIYDNWVKTEAVEQYFNDAYLNSDFDNKWISSFLHDSRTDSEEIVLENYEFRILLIIKEENKGKLNSHWWFFKVICEKLNPHYCFQLDCGTVPGTESLYHFWKYLENNKNVGAAASRVQVPTPLKPYSILQTWQYGDFAAQKLFDWPAEIISGYLTVLPGQFCVFRWKAISSNDEKTTPGEPQNLSPLDNYFRGLSNLGPFESNMFLAEDRILGYEIISRKDNGWQLAYVPEVVAITDACDTLTELFHQRRRWINSSFACNLWLIFKIFNYLKESGASFKQKIHTVFAIPWLVANCLIQWVFPSLILILIGSLLSTGISKESPEVITYLIKNLSLPLFSLMMIVQVIIFYRKRLSDKIEKVIIVTSIIQALIIFTGIIYWLINQKFIFGKLNLITILLIETSILLFTAGLLSKIFFRDLLKNVLQFMIIRPFMLMLLTMYSFSNVHDCSWGTKGLNNSSGRIKSSSGNIKSLQFKKFRVIALGIWIGSNLLMVIYFLNQTYAYKESLMGILLYFFVLFTGFKIISALIFAIKPFCKNLKISEIEI